MELSFAEISKAAKSEAKVEDDLDQMFAYLSNPSSMVEKTYDLQEAY